VTVQRVSFVDTSVLCNLLPVPGCDDDRGDVIRQLHQFPWDAAFLRELVEGAGTGIPLADHAMAKFGCGDLGILAERRLYSARTGLSNVDIWTLDAALAAHAAATG
jgi:hypothetical protein